MADDVGELSFEALIFGDENEKRKDLAKKSQPSIGEEFSETATRQELSDQEFNSASSSSDAIPSKVASGSSNVLLVYTSYGAKLNSAAVISFAEQHCGKVKVHNFREKQCFGFLQFDEEEGVEKALQKLNNVEIDGSIMNGERCQEITPGRDPRTHDFKSEYKNSTLVLKNLPFQLKLEKLEEILNSFPFKPLNVSYLYDEKGLFRGMAFVKFKEIEHGTKVFEMMNGMDINGRKVRIEYKRKVKEVEVPLDDDVDKLSETLQNFTTGSLTEIAFPCSSSFQRKHLHQLAENFGLGHYSTGDTESKLVLVKKKDKDDGNHSISGTSLGIGNPVTQGQPIKSRRQVGFDPSKHHQHHQQPSSQQRHSYGHSLEQSEWYGSGGSQSHSPEESKTMNGLVGSSPTSGSRLSSSSGSKLSRSFGSDRNSVIKSPPSLMGTSPTYKKSAAIMNRNANEGVNVQLVRQPKGPDGSKGFSSEYRKRRSSPS